MRQGVKPYGNPSRDSGIVAYDYGPDWIQIQFRRVEKPYTYRAHRVGAANLEEMKRLADAGDGLATFINTHPEARDGYDL